MDVSTRVVTAIRAVPIERSRLLPVDWLRGLVMVLMTVDHASSSFNASRLIGDSSQSWVPGTVLPAAQFFTRWVTHLCAPTFLFLAGYSLFISVQRRKRDGLGERPEPRPGFAGFRPGSAVRWGCSSSSSTRRSPPCSAMPTAWGERSWC